MTQKYAVTSGTLSAPRDTDSQERALPGRPAACRGTPAAPALVGGMVEGYTSGQDGRAGVSGFGGRLLPAVYASRARTSRKVTAMSAAASTRKMPASNPWKAQNLPAGWEVIS